jgi:hypothetical protein
MKTHCNRSKSAVALQPYLWVLAAITANAQPHIKALPNGNWPKYTRGLACDIEIVGQHAYVTLENVGLAVVNVSDPTRCVRVGCCDTVGNALGVAVAANHAYVAELANALR